MKRKFVSLFTIAVFCMTLLSTWPSAVHAEENAENDLVVVQIGSTNLTAGKYYNIGENGILQDANESDYDIYLSGNTLNLNNFNFSGSDNKDSCAVQIEGNIILNLIGENSVTYLNENDNSTNYGLYVNGDLTITGNGSLKVVAQALKDEGPAYDIYGKSEGIRVNGTLTYNGTGSIVAQGGDVKYRYNLSYGIYVDGAIIMNGSGSIEGKGGEGPSTLAEEDRGYCGSEGIYCAGNVTVTQGNIKAVGGNGTQYSFSNGMDAGFVKVDHGILEAIGGNANTENAMASSTGLMADSIEVNGGKLTTKSGIAGNAFGAYVSHPDSLNVISPVGVGIKITGGEMYASANGTVNSWGVDIITAAYTFSLTDGKFVAESISEHASNKSQAAYSGNDYAFKSTLGGCEWRYEKEGTFIHSGDIETTDHTYLEIQKSNYEFGNDGLVLTPSSLTYGEPLSKIHLSGNLIDDGQSIEGTYVWDEPEVIPHAGTYAAAWTFTSSDGSNTTCGTSLIMVEKVDVKPSWTVASVDSSGHKLYEIKPGPFKAVNNEEKTVLGRLYCFDENNKELDAYQTEIEKDVTYYWKFIPEDWKNYEGTSGSMIPWTDKVPEEPVDPDDPDVPVTPEEPDEPDTPSNPSEPSEPEEPAFDVTTDEAEATTTAKPDVSVSSGTASATVSEAMGEVIVEQVVENGSDAVVIAPEMDSDTTSAEITVPATTVAVLGNDTNAALTVDTPIGTVILSNSGLSGLAEDTDTITISLEVDNNVVQFTINDDNGAVASVDGGVKLIVPADVTAGTVAVIVHDDGTREVVRKSVPGEYTVIVPLDGSATIEIVDNSKIFDDVVEGAWYDDAVAFASSHELFNGTSDTAFSPDAGMTRGMLAAVLSNLERGDGSDLDVAFGDVANDAWYAEAVAWAAENGIVNGLGNGMFGPEDLITREQMAAMLYNYADMLGVDTSARADLNTYSDADSVSSWAREVMSWANATGLITGTTTTTLDPQSTATRAQVAAMLERFVILIAE